MKNHKSKFNLSILITVILSLSLTNCNTENNTNTDPESNQSTTVEENQPANEFVASIEEAHGKTKFLNNNFIQFDILLIFKEKERLNGTITLSTDSKKALIESKDSITIFVDGMEAYYSENIPEKKARFDAYTWSYFFLLPYKLSDNGTHWSDSKKRNMSGAELLSQKLTFGENIGDAPDDWYIIYQDEKTNLINYAAYIVTASASVEKAEENPHAIGYSNYQKIDGIEIAHNWVFYEWNQAEGVTDTIGKAQLSNIQFMEDAPSLENVPEGLIKSK